MLVCFVSLVFPGEVTDEYAEPFEMRSGIVSPASTSSSHTLGSAASGSNVLQQGHMQHHSMPPIHQQPTQQQLQAQNSNSDYQLPFDVTSQANSRPPMTKQGSKGDSVDYQSPFDARSEHTSRSSSRPPMLKQSSKSESLDYQTPFDVTSQSSSSRPMSKQGSRGEGLMTV